MTDTPGIGDNSTHRVDGSQLRSFCERIENRVEEKKSIQDDIKDIFAEAKLSGYDPKVLRALIKYRAADKAEREEFEAILELYIDNAG